MIFTRFQIKNIIKYGIRYNTTFEDQTLSEMTIVRKISQKDLDIFSSLCGDTNPIHSENVPAEQRFVHGAFLNSIVSGVIGSKVPGPGSIVISQKFKFPHRCKINEDVELNVRLVENRKIIKVLYYIKQNHKVVFEGEANLIRRTLLKD